MPKSSPQNDNGISTYILEYRSEWHFYSGSWLTNLFDSICIHTLFDTTSSNLYSWFAKVTLIKGPLLYFKNLYMAMFAMGKIICKLFQH